MIYLIHFSSKIGWVKFQPYSHMFRRSWPTLRCLIKGETLISGYYIKNSEESGKFSVYYMKNKGKVSKSLKLNKRGYPFIKHLRVAAVAAQNSSSKMWLIDNCV